MKNLILIISLIITSFSTFSQYRYDEIATRRFIHSIREYRVINGIDVQFEKNINTAILDSTWNIFIQDSIKVSDEIELPILYGVDPADMNRVISEAYANVMFNQLITKNNKFKEFCESSEISKYLIIGDAKYTSTKSYYVFSILIKI